VTEFLQQNKNEFDIVICDPPKFAPSQKDLPAATRGCEKDKIIFFFFFFFFLSRSDTTLNMRAMRSLRIGGFFASSSCSSAISDLVRKKKKTIFHLLTHFFLFQAFERILFQASRGRELQLVSLSGAGPDHPSVPGSEQTRYLKFALCRVL
jgi:23S rRNA (cytosine1962-C5)-methyltransferase